jgi:hypothetical protein
MFSHIPGVKAGRPGGQVHFFQSIDQNLSVLTVEMGRALVRLETILQFLFSFRYIQFVGKKEL